MALQPSVQSEKKWRNKVNRIAKQEGKDPEEVEKRLLMEEAQRKEEEEARKKAESELNKDIQSKEPSKKQIH